LKTLFTKYIFIIIIITQLLIMSGTYS